MPVVLAGLLIMFTLWILMEWTSFNWDHSIFSKCTLDHKIASLIQHLLGIELSFNILVLGNVLTGHFGKLHKVENLICLYFEECSLTPIDMKYASVETCSRFTNRVFP